MRKHLMAFGGVISAVLVLAAVAMAADDMAGKVAAAKSAADHQALAAEYDTQAKEATAEAERHEKMAKSYEGLGKMGQYHVNQYCANLVKSSREQAKDLQALADAHRAAAKEAK